MRRALFGCLLLASNGFATPRQTALDWISRNESILARSAADLFDLAEPAHHEVRTAAYLQAELRRAGFEIESGVAGLPTAFVASFGRGGPIVGIVALLDALPGNEGAWHGCGHNLIGAADLGAALAVKEALASHGLPGTIRFYGAPAEEIYHGGVYIVREGLFDNLVAPLFWLPSSVSLATGLAIGFDISVGDGRVIVLPPLTKPQAERQAIAATVMACFERVNPPGVPQQSTSPAEPAPSPNR